MRLIHDWECLLNCSTLTTLCVDSGDVRQFVIHVDRDDTDALRDYLSKCTLMIGFNSLNFDVHLTELLLTGDLPKRSRATAIYREAKRVITAKDRDEYIRIQNPTIPQLDLYEVWGLQNPARQCGLKFLGINMGFENIMDMPIHHSEAITIEQVPLVLEYNLNDVRITYELYKRSESKIRLREKLSQKYGVDMSNFPDPKIGETIVLKKLSEKTGTTMSTLKKCRTFYKELRLRDCILPTISFKTDEFKQLLRTFQEMVVKDTRKTKDTVVRFDDVAYYFGMGGLHACRNNGVYRNVHSSDVSGYYPSLAVAQGFFPKQFGVPFVQVYSEIAKERAMYEKGSDESTGLKLAQNGVFGKSNSEYSPFYDPMFFSRITINGQLLLAMLCERITIMGAGKIIMANTDGIEVDILDQEKFMWLCGEWEKKFGLKLEHSKYKLLAVRDINNYVGITDSGKIKAKGAFKTIRDLDRDGELYKDYSMGVITEAIESYFLTGTPIEDFINQAPDTRKFLIGLRAKQGKFVLRGLRNGELFVEPLPKHLRYYVSKGGGSLVKMGTKAANSQIHKGYQVTLLNQLGDMRFINRQFYVKECRKLLDSIIQV